MALRIFVDFDGTVTTDDVGNLFFRKFAGPAYDTLLRDYRAGALSAQQCFRGGLEAMGRVAFADVDSFLRARSLTNGFPAFVAFCRERALDMRILSDGLDYYINAILTHHGIGDVPFSANVLCAGRPDEGGRSDVSIRFPHEDAECDRCACCKRNLMVTNAGDDDVIVYVGDGFSDRCAVQYADIVFAKGELQTYCQQENISYFLYATFDDVTARLEGLLERSRFRRRRKAEIRRRALFMREP